MKPFSDETELAAALRAMRPTPQPRFAAELDARAAAGFPPENRPGTLGLSRLADRLRSIAPRRVLAPAGALALSALVVATAVVATSENGSTGPVVDSGSSRHGKVHFSAPVSPAAEGGDASAPTGAAPAPGKTSAASGQSSATQESSATEFEAAPPTTARSDTGPYASRAAHRDVERDAQIVLGAEPAEVRADAAKVFDAVHAADGIVLSSSIRDGQAGQAGADFELLIPSGKVGDALASFGAIAEVRSRHEATQDITAPTVSTGEKLQDANARVRSLLSELAAADSDAERVAAEAELRAARAQAAALRSRLSALDRRANFSRVSLRIETSEGHEGSSGGWGVDDGLDDAGRVLAVAAGVTIVGLAILAPLAAILLLAWLGRRGWIRHSRSRALARA